MSDEQNDFLSEMIEQSGFTIIPVEKILDMLAEMEAYVSAQTGIPLEELDGYMDRLTEVVGEDETMTMDLDTTVDWLNTLKQS